MEYFIAKERWVEKIMNKEIIVCIFVVLLIIITNIITQNYTKEAVETMDKKLETLGESIQDGEQKEEINEKMSDVMNTWHSKYLKLTYYIEHDEIEKVETELTELKADIDEEDYENALPPLKKSIFILNHIKEKFKLNLKNVF